MNTIKSLRGTRDAALAALQAAEADDTMTESELRRLRRDFKAAHAAWLDAATEAACNLAGAQA